jgi:hypothetical protein
MNLNTNGAKAIAALVVLNAGLFLSHHRVLAVVHGQSGPAIRAQIAASRAEICKAQTAARMAATEARTQARVAQREAMKARRQVQGDAVHAAVMAPSSASVKTRTTVTDYVRCILSSSKRAVNGGI